MILYNENRRWINQVWQARHGTFNKKTKTKAKT